MLSNNEANRVRVSYPPVQVKLTTPFRETIRAMAMRDELLANQRRWAEANELTTDPRGYLPSYSANLWRPLSTVAMRCYDRGSGSELRPGRTRQAKMCALHSSSALVANVFDYWSERDARPLFQALGADEPDESIQFEVQFPTGLAGEPPNLDIAVRLRSGTTLAIESKFCEWLTPKSGSKPPFKDKYFAPVADRWSRACLPNCQQLANEMQARTERFAHLDAPQLLKHALGLGTTLKGQFALWYLWYDSCSPEADRHRHEIDRFAARVGDELRFRALTYQELFEALSQRCGAESSAYLAYLRGRYFQNAGGEQGLE